MTCLKFIKECFELQNLLSEEKSNLHLNPFSYPLCSLSGYVFKLFKLVYLNKENIYAINNEFGKSSRKTSLIENEWASVMDFLYPTKKFQSEFNNDKGQKVFLQAIPDLYSKETKQCYFFMGCKIHGHLSPTCPFNGKNNENSLNPFGKTFKELNENFFKQMENLLLKNSEEINEIIIEWQCNYLEKRKDPIIKSFLEICYKPHIGYRLKPRCTVRGSYTDVFGLKWTKKEFPNEKFVFVDVNNFYSFVSIKYSFMTGPYEVLMGSKLKNVTIVDNKFFYKERAILGSILLTIIPNKNLWLPFLLYRREKDDKNFNTLCKLCCETESLFCTHSDVERAITSTYMISEIEYALVLGYKILNIYEIHAFVESDFILKPFMEKLNFLKTKHSDCFENCKTKEEKVRYCNFLNSRMNLQDPLLLTPENVKFNYLKRNFYKLCSNSLLGKLEQRHDKSRIIFASSNSEIENIYYSDNEIENFYVINDKICELHVKPNVLKLGPNRKSNCYLGAQVTAYARQTIHEIALKLTKLNYKLFHINCDSIMFSLPITDQMPFEVSHAVGDFKFEINDEILSYYSLGNKCYSIEFKTDQNIVKTLSKICGISLNGQTNEEFVNAEIFSLYMKRFQNQEEDHIKINQKRFKRNFKEKNVSSKFTNITFSNQLSVRRIVSMSDLNFKTFPYGYNCNANEDNENK